MTKNELLELSAKALGIEVRYSPLHEDYIFEDEDGWVEIWNPFLNDSQVLQLMATYKPSLMVGANKYVGVEVNYKDAEGFLECRDYEVWYQDHPSVEAAIRYAIVLGAAEAYKLRMEYNNVARTTK